MIIIRACFYQLFFIFSRMKTLLSVIFSLFTFYAIGSSLSKDSIRLKITMALNDSSKTRQYIALAKSYIDENVDSSAYYISKAGEIANRVKFKIGQIQVMNIQGNILQRKGQLDAAMDLYKSAKELADQIQHDSSLAMLWNNIGIIHTNQGNFDEAIAAYYKGIKFEELIGNSKGVAEGYNNIGVVHYYLSDMDNTLLFLKKSTSISKQIGDLEILKKGYINIGAIHRYLGEYEDALNYYNEGLKISEGLNNQADINTCWHNIAEVYSLMGKYEQSEAYYMKALVFNKQFDNKHGLALEYNNLGSLYTKQDKYQQAINSFDAALTIANTAGFRKLKEDIYQGYATLYARKKEYQKAYEYNLLYLALKDSILNEENTKSIAELRTKYETAEKEKLLALEKSRSDSLRVETAILDKRRVEAELTTSNRNKWIVFLVLAVIGASLFYFAAVQRTKRKAQAEKDAILIRERDKGLTAVIEAQEDERKRISKDLHDGIGQQLSGLKMAFQRLEGQLLQEIPHRKEELKQLVTIISESADEVRNISHQMMPRALTEYGLIPATEDMLSKSLGPSGINYEFEHYAIEGRLNERLEVSLYRIIQELINNIIKHSSAKQVNIQLFKNAGRIILIIEDNGKGFDHQSTSEGHGLLNIKSRLNSLNGEVNYSPSPGSGTVATIRIPIV